LKRPKLSNSEAVVPEEEAETFFKTSAATHSQTQHHFSEDQNLNYTTLKTSKSLYKHNL